ncbi:MAG TPA: DUF6531 domain-containing protein [Solirubrobacteraceae bacterium]|nr:DUF6531 domain-containing protein [Solirubrobacteraceae bacterium]
MAALLLALAVAPAGASAESLCTVTRTGPSEGEWQVASDWSTGKVPSSSDVACVGSGKTVKVTSGSDVAGVLQGEGGVTISGGSLELTNTLEGSTIHTLSLTSGTLTGAGTLKVSVSLSWTGGTMSGSGATVLGSSASGSKEGSSEVFLAQRMLVNEGTFTLSKGLITMREGAELKSTGTFVANAGGTVLAAGGGAASLFLNTGTLQKTSSGETVVNVDFENQGTVNALTGEIAFNAERTVVLTNGSVLEGSIVFDGPSVTGYAFQAPSGTVKLTSGTLSIAGGSTAEVANFVMSGGPVLTGAGTLEVSSSLTWKGGTMQGTGSTVLLSGVSYTKEELTELAIKERTLVNEGSFTISKGLISLEKHAVFENIGTFTANAEGVVVGPLESAKEKGSFINEGIFQKTAGEETSIVPPFENDGIIKELSGRFLFKNPIYPEPSTSWGGEEASQEPAQCGENESVSCQTGNYSQTQTDFSIGGRGVGLVLGRTYNSQAAVEGIKGPFGYGWSSSFSDHLVGEPTTHTVKLVQASGTTVTFLEGSGETFKAPAWTQDILSGSSSSGYILTLENQTVYKFSGSTGTLESVTDRNGNATTLSYNGSGNLETITDPAGRKIKLVYNSEGLVESAEDPMKHVVKYTYESGNLKSVTQPGEINLRWQLKYGSSHRMIELVDGRGGKSTIEYNASNQVVSETDPMKRITSFEYTAFHTTTTNHATGDVTVQYFTSNGMGTSVTNGYGTASATTETRTYNSADELLRVIDGNGHTTKYGYDTHGNRTSVINPDSDETKWEYNSTHDVISTTIPSGEKTTIKRDSHGNPEVIERPAPGGKTQITKYKYGTHGEVESMTDPLEHTWKYEYDSYGDRTAEIDPEGNKRTWEYNEDSQETGMVSPRGHVKAGEEEKYRTKTERDAQGRPIKVTDPLGHVTEYKYDGNGNVEKTTDANGHTTSYTYDADNERTKVEAPNKDVTELEYDGAGQVIAEIDGDKHKTKYKRNVLEEVVEIADPLGHVTGKEYDAAGNLTKLTDPAKRTTTYTYDPANRITEVSYSSGKPSTVKYEYDKDGSRTKIIDGTGTTNYTYDQLDRMTESENSHKEVVKYEYDLANDQVKITNPGGKEVTRTFDKDRRLEKVTDWLEHTTKFTYDPDSHLEATVFPSETKNEDKYAYNDGDQITEVDMLKGTETLASLAYTRDNDNQVKKTTAKGLPGEEVAEATYDEDNRVTKYGSTEYKYDAANNPTHEASSENTYNEGDELEKGTGVTYSYDELGERTKTKPSTGPATSYGYDQAGELTSVERPKEGEPPEIKDSYEYNGEGLRTSRTINGTTTYLVWDVAEALPLILGDGTSSYIYGPDGYPIEQINNSTSTVTYLHHDQQGSTRLLTGSTGKTEATLTYDAYGNLTGKTGTATTPLGYDGQYTNTDTGLIYLRARSYDPATGQFLSVDPKVEQTGVVYTYAQDNPLAGGDPTGACPTASASAFQGGTKSQCEGLLKEIVTKRSVVLKRVQELLEDRQKLPLSEIKSHIKALKQAQTNLRKLLKKFGARQCREEWGLELPADIYEVVEIEVRVHVVFEPAP